MSQPSPSSNETRTMPVYEALALDIKARGCEVAFGLISDDTAMLVTALDAAGVRFCSARHETNAIAMAEGYAAATGRLGIAILGRGPAMANALHGAIYANRSGSKVLLIFGASPLEPAGPDPKRLDAIAVLHGSGIKTVVASNPGNARQSLDDAIRATEAGNCASLLLPVDVQFASIPWTGDRELARAPASPRRVVARRSAVDAAAALLAKSRKPLFVAGGGAHRSGARDALISLADKVGAVVATTLKGKDLFQGYPYNLGVVGSFSHAVGRRLIAEADCIVAFGASLNNHTTSYGEALPRDVPVIHVDMERSNIGRLFPADIGLVGDVLAVAGQLLEAASERNPSDKPFHSEENVRRLAGRDVTAEFQSADTPRTMDPRSLGVELDRILPKDRSLVYDAGNFLQIIPYLSVPGPDRIKMTAEFASIGLGFGVALGYALGSPGRRTTLIIGDGAFLMTLSELETVVREDIPITIIVMNDAAYGAELHYLRMRDVPDRMSVFADVDFAPVAEAFGFQAATVRSTEALRQFEAMLAEADGPILLDCKINASVAGGFLGETFDHERRARA